MNEQTTRRPLWKRTVVFSEKKNVSILIWPGWPQKDGSEGPRNITIQQSRNTGSKEDPKWENQTVYLTKDKTPLIQKYIDQAWALLDVQEIGSIQSTSPMVPAIIPSRPQEQPTTLTGLIYKAVMDEGDLLASESALVSRFDTSYEAIQEAILQLEQKGHVKKEMRGLSVYLMPGVK